MMPLKSRRSVVLLLLFVSLSGLLAIADRAPLHLDKRHPEVHIEADFYRYYEGVASGSLPGPYSYRVLVPWTIGLLHSLVPSASELTIDLILKLLVLCGIQLLFYRFSLRFLPPIVALGGLLWLDVLTGVSLSYVQGPSAAETMDLLNLLIIIAALLAAEKPGTVPVAALIFLGMLNRETPLMLLPLFLLYDRWGSRGYRRTLILSIVALAAYFSIRMLIHPVASDWATTEGLRFNLPGIDPETSDRALVGFVHVSLLLGPLFFLGFSRYREKPPLLQAALLVSPLLVVIHYLFGTAIESRLWLPLYAFLVPPSLWTLRGLFSDNGASRD